MRRGYYDEWNYEYNGYLLKDATDKLNIDIHRDTVNMYIGRAFAMTAISCNYPKKK